jgi:hypothetical protein
MSAASTPSPNNFYHVCNVMLGSQPFFITGIEDVEAAQQNAFGALMTFVATFVLSLLG